MTSLTQAQMPHLGLGESPKDCWEKNASWKCHCLVWIWPGRIIGLFFTKNEIINDDYLLIITQDRATCQAARETSTVLQECFPGRDLTPMKFFVWGYLRFRLHANMPTTTQTKYRDIKTKPLLKISTEYACVAKALVAIY